MKDFKGLVKISDVQNSFDEIVNNLNDMVDAYNASAKVLDIDYTKGSAELGASGYTLTVGGLKQIINTYQGCSVGCKAFKIDANHCKVTPGFIFADNKVYRANEQDMTGSGTQLYYDVDNNRYSFGEGATTSIQTITIPQITNNVSWGNIWATSNGTIAWQVPSMIATGEANSPYKGWATPNQLNVDWTWEWDFPTTLTGHVKFYAMDAFAYDTYHISAIGGTESNFKKTAFNETTSVIELDINNAKGLKLYGRWTKRSAYIQPFVIFSGMQITEAKAIIITAGDEDHGRLIKICDLNWNRDSKQLATINKTMSESDNRSITIQAQSLPFNSNNGYSGSGDFIWATDNPTNGDGTVNLFGRKISHSVTVGGSTMRSFSVPTYFYIPKGVNNPFTAKLSNTYKAKYKN